MQSRAIMTRSTLVVITKTELHYMLLEIFFDILSLAYNAKREGGGN